MHTRRFILAANWKLNKTPEDVPVFFREFLQAVEALPSGKTAHVKGAEVIVFPTSLLAGAIQAEFKNLQNSANYPKFSMSWGGQNCYVKGAGAFTGETSAQTLAHMGARSVLIGHSERRTLFNEAAEFFALKVQYAQSVGLTPILCVGETLDQRQNEQTQNILKTQLSQALHLVDPAKPFHIAYEPVWAIGTGVVATPEQVAEAHRWVREIVTSLQLAAPQKSSGGASANILGSEIPILYGGSVSLENQSQLRTIANVDGFLVGGASLKGDSFAQLLCEH